MSAQVLLLILLYNSSISVSLKSIGLPFSIFKYPLPATTPGGMHGPESAISSHFFRHKGLLSSQFLWQIASMPLGMFGVCHFRFVPREVGSSMSRPAIGNLKGQKKEEEHGFLKRKTNVKPLPCILEIVKPLVACPGAKVESNSVFPLRVGIP